MSKLQKACQTVAAFAKKIGRAAISQHGPGAGLIEFDTRLLKAILDTRDDALVDAACLLVQEEVRVIKCAN